MLRFVVGWGLLLASLPAMGADTWQYPLNVAADKEGNLYVADRNLPGIWKVTPEGEKKIFYQASKKFRTPLNAVRCVTVDRDGKVLAGDSSTRDVYRFSDAGEPEPLTKGAIGIPMSIAVASSGELFVADLERHRIYRVPAAGGKADVFAELPAPRALTIDSQDNVWVISDAPKPGDKDMHQVVRLTPDGKAENIVAGRVFEFPGGIAVDSEGAAYVTDGYGKAIWKVAPGGKPEKWVIGEPLDHPVGIVQQGERFLVSDPRAKAIFQISADGKVSRLAE